MYISPYNTTTTEQFLVQIPPCRVRQCLTRGLQTVLGLFYGLLFPPLLHRGYGALRALLKASIQRWRHSGCAASWGKPARSSSSCANLKHLAKRLLPSWVHRSSFKGRAKRATVLPRHLVRGAGAVGDSK